MPSFRDGQRAVRHDLRPDIAVLRCGPAQALVDIQLFHRFGGRLDPLDFCSDPVADLIEDLQFKPHTLFLRADNLLLHLLEFRRHEPFGIRQCLLPDIAVRNLAQEALCHFDIIPENLIVLNPQIPDPGLFPFLCLQVQDPLTSVLLGFPVFVEYFGVTVADDPAFRDQDRCIRMDCFLQQRCQIFHRIE